MRIRLLIALLLLATGAQAKTITLHHGGRIAAAWVEMRDLKRSGEIVRIAGYCASACTLHLANPNTCATPRAVLVFHAASNAAGTRFLMAAYPAPVRSWIVAHGGLTRKLLTARGREAQMLAGPCPLTSAG